MPLTVLRRARPPAALLLPAAVLALTASLTLAAPASAHDSIVGSTPADGSTVSTAPTEVRITFEEPPTTAGLGVAVTAPGGASVVSGAPAIDGTVVVQQLQPLTAAGAYTVAFRVVSADGHPVTGTVGFTYAAPSPTASATASPGSSSTAGVAAALGGTGDASSASPTPWVVAGSLGLLVVVVLVGLGLRRRSA